MHFQGQQGYQMMPLTDLSHYQSRNHHLQLFGQLGWTRPIQLHLYIQAQKTGQEHHLLLAQVPN